MAKKWGAIRRPRGLSQKLYAEKLVRDGNLRIPREGCGLREIKFQNYLAQKSIAIVVYKFRTLGHGDKPIFDGTSIVENLKVSVTHTLRILYYSKRRHFQPILNFFKATASQGYCIPCNKSYRYEQQHRCSFKYKSCFWKPLLSLEKRGIYSYI